MPRTPAKKTAPPANDEGSRLSTIIPTPVHKAIKMKAVETDTSIQDIVAEALEEWLDRN